MKIRIFTQDSSNFSSNNDLTFKKKDSKIYNYLVNVLKVNDKNAVYFFNDIVEKCYYPRNIDKNKITLTYKFDCNINEDISSNPSLIFPVIKSDKIVQIAKQATELGALNLYPFTSERTQELNYFNETKIFKNIIESLEQSGGSKMPNLHKPDNIFKILQNLENQNTLIGSTPCDHYKYPKCFNVSQKYHNCIIGPEGGFSESEIRQFSEFKNVYSINISKRILRSETAAICLLAKIF